MRSSTDCSLTRYLGPSSPGTVMQLSVPLLQYVWMVRSARGTPASAKRITTSRMASVCVICGVGAAADGGVDICSPICTQCLDQFVGDGHDRIEGDLGKVVVAKLLCEVASQSTFVVPPRARSQPGRFLPLQH